MSTALMVFESKPVELIPIEKNGVLDYWIAEVDLVRTLDVSKNALRKQRKDNPEIFRQGIHYENEMVTIRDQLRKRIIWSPRGINRLLMRLNVPKAIQFQDALEDLLESLRTGKITIQQKADAELIRVYARNIAMQANINRLAAGEDMNLELEDTICQILIEHAEGKREGDNIAQLINRWLKDTTPLLAGKSNISQLEVKA